MADPILIAKADKNEIYLLPKLANRHGLIAGATGTGKTVTLQTLAENFSARGVPVHDAGPAYREDRSPEPHPYRRDPAGRQLPHHWRAFRTGAARR